MTSRSFSRIFSSLTLFGALTSTFFGCGGSQVESSGSSGLPKGTATSDPVASPDKPAASAIATEKKETPPPAVALPPSPFHIVADVPYELAFHRLGKSAVLMADFELLQFQANTITFDPNFAITKELRGDGVLGAFESLLGVLPNALYAAVVRPTGRTGFTEIYKWTGTKWMSDYSSQASTSVLDIQPWINGTVLVAEMHSLFPKFQFSAWPKTTKVFVPEPREIKWNGVVDFCEVGFIPNALRTSTTGHAFMTGESCTKVNGKEQQGFAIKRFSAAEPKGKMDELPEVGSRGLSLVDLVLRNEKDAYFAGNLAPRGGNSRGDEPYLAHFDGTSWSRDTLPFSDGIASIDIDPKGTVWLVSIPGAVYSRPVGGKWNEITLPSGGESGPLIKGRRVWARGTGDEWIVGFLGTHHYVLHSGPAGEKAKLPDHQAMTEVVEELAMPTPLTWHCRTPFVLIYTLSKVAPPDFDYPATREALKGHREFADARFIEFKRLDKRYMGAFVDNEEMGKKLVDLVKKKIPNSTPQLACHSPKPSRELDFGLAGN
jgi:hypothetical protein